MGFHRQRTMSVWRNPDNVTHRQLLSIDQVWRRSTALTWSRWGCRRLADNIWLLAHANNNNYSGHCLTLTVYDTSRLLRHGTREQCQHCVRSWPRPLGPRPRPRSSLDFFGFDDEHLTSVSVNCKQGTVNAFRRKGQRLQGQDSTSKSGQELIVLFVYTSGWYVDGRFRPIWPWTRVNSVTGHRPRRTYLWASYIVFL